MPNLASTALARPKKPFDLRQPKNLNSFRKGAQFIWFRVGCLVVSDSIALLLAWILASAYSSSYPSFVWPGLTEKLYDFLAVWCVGLSTFATAKFYRSGSHRKDYFGLVRAISLISLTVFFLFEYFHIAVSPLPALHFLVFWVSSIVLVVSGRFLVNFAIANVRRAGMGLYPIFLIADREDRTNALATINGESHYKVLGASNASVLDQVNRDSLIEQLHRLGVIEIFIAWDAIKNRLFLCNRFQSEGFTVRILPSDELPPPSAINYTSIGGRLCLSCTPTVLSGFEFWTKRVVDMFVAATAIVLISPIYILIALLIYLDSPGPIFYKQTRIGLKERPFKVWKFRTMVPNADQLQKELESRNETSDGVLFKIKDDPRITRVGKHLRQYSLDELPQLFNVLLGEMSLVGPRPLPLRDVEKFSKHHHIRQEVLPGITGLWQISGRSNIIDFEQAYQLDLTYITRWSIFLDLQILFKTVGVVLQKSGAY